MSAPNSLIDELRFDGRILFLSEDPDLVERQLSGEDLELSTAGALRSDVSTDEISPTWITYHYDEKLGEFPYLALKCGDKTPIIQGSVKRCGFGITVAGRRYGKGSSREASPYAELSAGIRLVIAESFERIYRQNCRNIGLLTSTDFGLIDRIRRGESIPIEEFTRNEDEITCGLIKSGGLFALMQARQKGWDIASPSQNSRPMTYAEKILARASEKIAVQPGQPIFAKTDWRYAHEYNSPLGISSLERAMGKNVELKDPESIVFFADHLTFIHRSMPEERKKLGMLTLAQALAQVQQQFAEEHGALIHGFLADREGSEGISHSLMTERYVLPGQLAVGTDSHTPHCGAIGAFAFGIGSTEMACAWVSGEVQLKIPQTCVVNLHGVRPEGVEAKDIVLHLLRLPYVREGGGIGQVFEFRGDVVKKLSTDERATLTNMVAEMGGFTGIVVPDEETKQFLKDRRGIDFELQNWMHSDPDAEVAHTIDIDCTTLSPMLAQPGDPGRGIEISGLASPVRIDIAYGGSCTGGKREDLERVYEVLCWAEKHGKKIAPHVRFILQFGSQDVRNFCEQKGMLDLFRRIGAELIEPGCGACVNAGPGVSEHPDQVTVSAINRNFPGRSGPGKVWLASPSTVAASAVAGQIVSFAMLRKNKSNTFNEVV